jgi:hypothetical protein
LILYLDSRFRSPPIESRANTASRNFLPSDYWFNRWVKNKLNKFFFFRFILFFISHSSIKKSLNWFQIVYRYMCITILRIDVSMTPPKNSNYLISTIDYRSKIISISISIHNWCRKSICNINESFGIYSYRNFLYFVWYILFIYLFIF